MRLSKINITTFWSSNTSTYIGVVVGQQGPEEEGKWAASLLPSPAPETGRNTILSLGLILSTYTNTKIVSSVKSNFPQSMQRVYNAFHASHPNHVAILLSIILSHHRAVNSICSCGVMWSVLILLMSGSKTYVQHGNAWYDYHRVKKLYTL